MNARLGRFAVGLVLGLPASLMLFSLASGCASNQDPEEPVPVPQGVTIPFVPQVSNAKINLAKGAYPDLFSETSYAQWGVAPETEGGGMVEVMCCLESAFADAGIAYDLVGLRGVSVYLYSGDGRHIAPARTLMGQELEEESRGALKVFRRINRLYFPTDQLGVVIPEPGAPAPAYRLVVEGFDSVFYFEWAAQMPQAIEATPFYKGDTAQAVKQQWNKARKKVGEWSHNFD